MRYKGKSVEIIGSKTLFGKETLWVHVLEDNTFMQVQPHGRGGRWGKHCRFGHGICALRLYCGQNKRGDGAETTAFPLTKVVWYHCLTRYLCWKKWYRAYRLKSNPTSFNALGKMSFKHNSNWVVSVVCHAPSQLVNEKSPFYFLDGKSKAYATRESTLLEVYIKDKAILRNSKLSCKRKTGHIVESWQWLFQKSEDKRELFLIFVCH